MCLANNPDKYKDCKELEHNLGQMDVKMIIKQNAQIDEVLNSIRRYIDKNF